MSRMPATAPIPQFALYGESALTHKPEFVHVEDIRARSERNGWLIKPHRHSHLFQILCVFSGAADVRVDTNASSHRGSWLVATPPGVVHGFRFEPDTDGIVLSLAVGMLDVDPENQLGALLEGVLAQPRIIKLQKSAPDSRELFQYFALLRGELAQPREGQQIVLTSLMKAILIALRRRLHQEGQDDVVQPGSVQLTNRLKGLLEQHYKQHWTIADYAQALHVSVSTLNRACHDVLGCTTKKLIQQRLHMEAKRRLIYTGETLDQISWDLGFTDAPYFSRVFKQLEGVSPKHFRSRASIPEMRGRRQPDDQ